MEIGRKEGGGVHVGNVCFSYFHLLRGFVLILPFPLYCPLSQLLASPQPPLSPYPAHPLFLFPPI